MEYERFTRICGQIYKTVDTRFSFNDCMKVFDAYFSCYHDFMGAEHPTPRCAYFSALGAVQGLYLQTGL